MMNTIQPNYTTDKAYGIKAGNQPNEIPAKQTQDEESGVILEIGKTPEKSVTYQKPTYVKPNTQEVQKLWEQAEKAYENLRSIVEKLILKQGKTGSRSKEETEVIEIDEETRAEAELAISEDGEFGVKAVSDRIVSFALAISGEDKSKLELLKKAIGQGFEAAKSAFGGELPEICSQTYDEVMRRLDAWAEEE
jgi:fructose-1-phosphate kinase PfkB-like protein